MSAYISIWPSGANKMLNLPVEPAPPAIPFQSLFPVTSFGLVHNKIVSSDS